MNMNLLEIKNENYIYKPLAYHDSWLSVDPIIGCRLNCQYCYMQPTHWTAVKPEYLYTVSEIVEMLIKYHYFVPDQTVIGFGNHTDAFLPDNIDYTLNFFETMENRGL